MLPQGITVLVKLNSGWGILSILLQVCGVIPFRGDQQTKAQITVECAPEPCLQLDGADAQPAEAAGSVLPASQLPWQQIPSFGPQTTDIQVYARKLQFLRDIWPQEHLVQLAPRAALQVQGVAFQKVAWLDTEKLRSESGVKYLVESLGDSWGKLASEEKLSVFERAYYQTVQNSDESNDSYLARHDASSEDMMAKGVSMEEVRAYVMIPQSQLSSEDRKRIVVETEETSPMPERPSRQLCFLLSHARFSGQTYLQCHRHTCR